MYFVSLGFGSRSFAAGKFIAMAAAVSIVGFGCAPLDEDVTAEEVDAEEQAAGTVYRVGPTRTYKTLADVPVPIDIVNVFRAPDALPGIAREAVAVHAKALWCQFTVINEDGARIAEEGGVSVVMDNVRHVSGDAGSFDPQAQIDHSATYVERLARLGCEAVRLLHEQDAQRERRKAAGGPTA